MSLPEYSPEPGEEPESLQAPRSVAQFPLGFDPDRAAAILDHIRAYDPAAPEAAHLRSHQTTAINAFRSVSQEIVRGTRPNRGMAILHPTGGGKTVTATDIIRMIATPTRNHGPLNVLDLVPGHQILGQTRGTEEELGAIQRFAPGVTVGEYSGRVKEVGAQATVMTYQSLPRAIEKGILDELDPALIICDESHHVIDGVWADAVSNARKGRLLLGMTATPVYNAERDISRLFPVVLDQRTMRQSIESGILAPVQGYLYRGKSNINITRRGADFADEDLFEAIAYSEDNQLEVKICVAEIEQGNLGAISCVPGHDRAHAKVLAEMLNHTTVHMPDGDRKIRAAYVGGELDKREINQIFAAHRRGEIDVITSVNLILEGWDSPETNFMVMMRPTTSLVLAEQRVGRVLRPRIGKTARVHEFIYGITGGNLQQITHLDVLGEGRVVQGHIWQPNRKPQPRDSERKSFNVHKFVLSPELAEKVAELNTAPLEEVRVLCNQEAIPLEWQTSLMLARLFKKEVAEVEQILLEEGIHSRSEMQNEIEHRYYPPRAIRAVANHEGLQAPPEGATTMSQLLAYGREFAPTRRLSREAIEAALAEEGLEPILYCFDNGAIAYAYPHESLIAVQALAEEIAIQTRGRSNGRPVTPLDANTWLSGILIHPLEVAPEMRAEIARGQRRLIEGIGMLAGRLGIDPVSPKAIERLGLEPSEQMRKVMQAKGISFNGLLAAAMIAKGVEDQAKAQQARQAQRGKKAVA